MGTNTVAGRIAAAGLLLVSSACFTGPVAPPAGLALDTRVLGAWDCTPVSEEADERAVLRVFRFDEQQYYAEWREGEKVDRYRAYPVEARGVKFLSVGELVPGTFPWTAVRYSVSPSEALDLQVPAKRILDMSDEAAVQALKSQADRSDAWQAFGRCVRPKPAALLDRGEGQR
jgi:hypothetical protein